MKAKTILVATIGLFFMIFGTGCEQENLSYQGKVISLNSGTGCFNIVEISKSIPQGLSVNSTITFDPRLYNGQLKVGDIVSFKIIRYEAWTPEPMFALCSAPQYVGQLEFYNKQKTPFAPIYNRCVAYWGKL